MPLSWWRPCERFGVWAYGRFDTGVVTPGEEKAVACSGTPGASYCRSHQHRSKHAYAFLGDAGYCLKKEPQ
jgi:hypothetical protein